MFEILKSFGINVHTQIIIKKIKSRNLSKEEKKAIYLENYNNPIEDKSIEVNNKPTDYGLINDVLNDILKN